MCVARCAGRARSSGSAGRPCAQALTSTDDEEIRAGLEMIKASSAGSGFMHESFRPDSPTSFTRSW
jgi:meiotically up-regulated gene 157 (Mug157) protein